MTEITDNPLVSIITPVLNGIKYLEPCLQSVLSQSYPRIEHIFVDGCSTDGTLEMLKSYAARYPDRIRFISERDSAVGEAWNKGVKLAKGEILGWLGSDDMSEPGAVQAVIEFFVTHPGAYFVFGDCNIINEKGELLRKYPTKDFNLEELLNNSCMVPTPSSFYRREVIEEIGYYNTNGNDYEFLIRAAEVFLIYRIKKVLSNFRIRKDSQTGAKKTLKMWLREDYLASRQHGGSILSGYAFRYFGFSIIEGLRPVLGRLYPFIYNCLVSPIMRLLRKLARP